MLRKNIHYRDAIGLLYPNYWGVSGIIKMLSAEKILCLSDTPKMFISDKTSASKSLAVHLERQLSDSQNNNAQSPYELTQAAHEEFTYSKAPEKFGAHLPQNKSEPRREYKQIDNTELKPSQNYDLVLGKALLCCCSDNLISCGGIAANYESQKKFLRGVIATGANLIVLSANPISFDKYESFYLNGKAELLKTAKAMVLLAPEYDIIFADNLTNYLFEQTGNNHGYALILAKKEALCVVNLPPDAKRINFEDSADKLVSGFEQFTFYAKLPEKLLLTTADRTVLKTIPLSPADRKQFYILRDLVGNDIIKKQEKQGIYEISAEYLITLKNENPTGFENFSDLLQMTSQDLEEAVSPKSLLTSEMKI